jgi:NTP pyrophosphatase (non-canonical NTP hydrolase)
VNEVKQVHEMVWAFREFMEPYWPTPGPADSLRYAFTEAGEAMDAWLRQQRPNDARNNERQPDVLDELADAAIMLCTAEIERPRGYYYPSNRGIDGICLDIALAGSSGRHPLQVVASLAEYPDMRLPSRVLGRLRAIYVKRWPVKNDERWERFVKEAQ